MDLATKLLKQLMLLTQSHTQLASELHNWRHTAHLESANRNYYLSLVEDVAEVLGSAAFQCDDGSVSPDPLRARVPELVRQLRQDFLIYAQHLPACPAELGSGACCCGRDTALARYSKSQEKQSWNEQSNSQEIF